MPNDNCENCYTCQKSISPEITADDIKKNGGKVKREWADKETQGRCSSCFSCESCFTSQAR
jgi:hypothetical protein